MTKKAIRALKASIRYWDDLIAGKDNYGPDGTGDPLCKAVRCCEACPIHQHTGLPFCRGTPYMLVKTAWVTWTNFTGREATWLRNARKWRAYLKSLLPKGDKA